MGSFLFMGILGSITGAILGMLGLYPWDWMFYVYAVPLAVFTGGFYHWARLCERESHDPR